MPNCRAPAVPPNQVLARPAASRVDGEASDWRADQADVEFKTVVQQGDPAKIILSHARSLRPDVIVIGTHQRRGIDRFVDGSVAEPVAAKATVPVLVVPWHRNADTIRPFRHVAVAVDFSAASDQAIARALMLANGPADRVSVAAQWCPASPTGRRRTCTATESPSIRTN